VSLYLGPRVGQNRMYDICAVYDHLFGDFPAKNVYTPYTYIYMVLVNPYHTASCWMHTMLTTQDMFNPPLIHKAREIFVRGL